MQDDSDDTLDHNILYSYLLKSVHEDGALLC